MTEDIKVLKIPRDDAQESELVTHFRSIAEVFASVPYTVAVELCFTCLKEGENITGKANNPSDRNRFCSDECEAVFDRRWKLYKERTVALRFTTEAKASTDSPSVQRRRAAPKTKRIGKPGGPRCGTCGNHPRSREHQVQCVGGVARIPHKPDIAKTPGQRAAPKCSRCGEHPRSASHRNGECKP